MAAAGLRDLTTLDVLLLHHVNHRAREKKLADISFMMNVEDTHVVAYSLKKLAALGLVKTEKRGKEVLFSTTAKGQQFITRYREVREACLIASLSGDSSENFELGELARFLRMLSGLYDQAARAATSL
jgi:predicted MarR family transcription regulator